MNAEKNAVPINLFVIDKESNPTFQLAVIHFCGKKLVLRGLYTTDDYELRGSGDDEDCYLHF